jgi:hypothetical protein
MYWAVLGVNDMDPLVDTFMRLGKSKASLYSIQACTPTLMALPEVLSL